MLCYPYVNKKSDKPCWVPIETFREHFCQKDFLDREVVNVLDEYRSDWFYKINGRVFFEIPQVYIINGHTEFISGRHRTAVLCSHLMTLPIAFAEGEAQEFAVRLGLNPMSMTEPLLLPDLPIT